jgi:hypothetical protein
MRRRSLTIEICHDARFPIVGYAGIDTFVAYGSASLFLALQPAVLPLWFEIVIKALLYSNSNRVILCTGVKIIAHR